MIKLLLKYFKDNPKERERFPKNVEFYVFEMNNKYYLSWK
jgi:hypothetical protein